MSYRDWSEESLHRVIEWMKAAPPEGAEWLEELTRKRFPSSIGAMPYQEFAEWLDRASEEQFDAEYQDFWRWENPFPRMESSRLSVDAMALEKAGTLYDWWFHCSLRPDTGETLSRPDEARLNGLGLSLSISLSQFLGKHMRKYGWE